MRGWFDPRHLLRQGILSLDALQLIKVNLEQLTHSGVLDRSAVVGSCFPPLEILRILLTKCPEHEAYAADHIQNFIRYLLD